MQYLIKDFGTKDKKKCPPVLREVNEDEMFNALDEAKNEELLISVYKLNECVLDWS